MYNYLFSEGKIGAVNIPNRIVMTAMGIIWPMRTAPSQKLI